MLCGESNLTIANVSVFVIVSGPYLIVTSNGISPNSHDSSPKKPTEGVLESTRRDLIDSFNFRKQCQLGLGSHGGRLKVLATLSVAKISLGLLAILDKVQEVVRIPFPIIGNNMEGIFSPSGRGMHKAILRKYVTVCEGRWYVPSLWEVSKASPYRGVSRQSLRREAHGLSIDKTRRFLVGEKDSLLRYSRVPDLHKQKSWKTVKVAHSCFSLYGILKVGEGRVVPLLPVALAHTESELKASVERLFDEGGSADQGDSATWGGQGTGTRVVKGVKIIAAEDVTAEKPKYPSKKRQAVTDASGSSNSPKKLKGNYGTSSGVATIGKSPSILIELLASSMLNVEGGVTAMATLPMVTSSVSAMPEHKSGTPVDSITGMNLRTIDASQMFFISLDSSYHSGANAFGAEDDSIIRSAAVPPVMTNAVVTSHAATAPSVLETGTKICDMDYHHLFMEFNVGTARQACLNTKVKIRTEDEEIENLKAWLLLKETKAVKAAHLRCQVSAAEAIEKIHTNEIDALKQRNDLELKDLNVAVSSLRSQKDGLVDQVHALETTCSGLCDQVSGSLGVVISHSTEKGMQDGLSANINHGKAGRRLADIFAYNLAAEVDYNSTLHRLREVDFPLLAELKSHKNASVKDIMNFLRLEGLLADAPGMNDL
nr:hypothetical protein [Tanacetum cinerariifolium]